MKKIFSFIFLLTICITKTFGQCNLPAAAGIITGFTNVCQTQTGTSFSVNTIANASKYKWAYSGTGVTLSSDTTNSITIDFSLTATSGILTVAGTNACGDGSSSADYNITVIPLPGASGTITGTSIVCQGATTQFYSLAAISNTNNYVWQYSGTGAIISGSTNSITIDFLPTATSGILTVMGSNDCTNGTVSPDFPITVNPIPQGSFMGNSICNGDIRNGQLTWIESSDAGPYTVIYNDGTANRTQTNVAGGIAFDSFNKPTNTNNYILISVASNNCSRTVGFIKDTATITVSSQGAVINSNPSNTSICAGANVSFAVSASGAYGYQWQVSTNGGINYSNILTAGTNPVYSNFATATLDLSGTSITNDGNKYKCLITASCGSDVTSDSATLTVNPLPAAAGTIIGTSVVCQKQNGVLYTVPAITNAANYIWTYSGSGVTLTVTSNTVTINFSSISTNGYLTVMGTTPFCNGIVSSGFPITVILSPTSAGLITGSHVVCQNQTAVSYQIPIFHNHSTNDYPTFTWAYSGTGATISGPTDPMTIDFSPTATSGILTVMRTQACGNGQISPNFAITVNISPGDPGPITGPVFDCHAPTQSTYSINALANATKYIWNYSGLGATISDSTNSTLIDFTSGVTPGVLTVKGINALCNGSVSRDSIYNPSTCISGIEEIQTSDDITIYPNPTNGIFNIAIKNANFSNLWISISDFLGKEVFNISDKNSSQNYYRQINLEDLAKGIYFVKLKTGTDLKTFKLSIQ